VREETSDGSDFWLLNMATAKKRESHRREILIKSTSRNNTLSPWIRFELNMHL